MNSISSQISNNYYNCDASPSCKIGMETGKKVSAVARESFKREKEKGLLAQQIGPTNVEREILNYQEILR